MLHPASPYARQECANCRAHTLGPECGCCGSPHLAPVTQRARAPAARRCPGDRARRAAVHALGTLTPAQSRSSVAPSACPSKYVSRTWLNTGSPGSARANRVIDERSFIASMRAEDVLGASGRRVAEQRLGALAQARAQHRVGQVGPGLLQGGDGEPPGGGAAAQPLDLREHEPHPVAGLAARAQLAEGAVVGAALVLRVDEPGDLVGRVGHRADDTAPMARARARRSTLRPQCLGPRRRPTS